MHLCTTAASMGQSPVNIIAMKRNNYPLLLMKRWGLKSFFTSSHLEFYLVKVLGVIAALLCTD
jgi:hypothetical protein